MGENSRIEWTDHTFNPWWGCEKVSPACDNCYAEGQARRLCGPKWRRVDYQVMTRGGVLATESLWCSFPEPLALHDYRYVGRTWRDRQNLRRMQKRWAGRLARMNVVQRQALLWALSLQDAAADSPLRAPTDGGRGENDAAVLSGENDAAVLSGGNAGH